MHRCNHKGHQPHLQSLYGQTPSLAQQRWVLGLMQWTLWWMEWEAMLHLAIRKNSNPHMRIMRSMNSIDGNGQTVPDHSRRQVTAIAELMIHDIAYPLCIKKLCFRFILLETIPV